MSIRSPDIPGSSSDVACSRSLIDHSYASTTSSSSDSEMESRPSERNFNESEAVIQV